MRLAATTASPINVTAFEDVFETGLPAADGMARFRRSLGRRCAYLALLCHHTHIIRKYA
jgi:hypothetical protein